MDAYEPPEHNENVQTEANEDHDEHKEDVEESNEDIHEERIVEHMSFADQPSRPHHLTRSYVHHEELPPVAAKLVHENQEVPSEAT